MLKVFVTCAALGVATLLALPDTANAASQRPDGFRNGDQIEVSAQRRYRRYYRHRYWGPRPYYYRPYYRPYYYGPGPFPFFGLGLGPFWW